MTSRALPFTEKADLREHYPFGLLAVPRERLVRVHASSGTGGKPTIVGYTAADLELWADLMARSMRMPACARACSSTTPTATGCSPEGSASTTAPSGSARPILPVSTGQTDAPGDAAARPPGAGADLHAVLCGARSPRRSSEEGIGPDDLALEVGLFGAEPWSESMRSSSNAGSACEPATSTGCRRSSGRASPRSARDGRRASQRGSLPVEVVDGELVITTLTKEALPLIRYRTGDIAGSTSAPCACGRTLARMGRCRAGATTC